MRVLSARVIRARRNRATARAEAIVGLLVREEAGATDIFVRISVSAPLQAPGAAALRDRLIAAAKLTYAATPRQMRAERFAA